MDLDALETSFDLVAPRGDELMEIFYARLFAEAPAVRPLFAGTEMARQRQMLLAALTLVRNSLRDLDSLLPALRKLGARHVAYGVRAAHYPAVGSALTRAMAEVAGDAWEPRFQDAWSAAFGVLAEAMLAGAAAARLAVAA